MKISKRMKNKFLTLKVITLVIFALLSILPNAALAQATGDCNSQNISGGIGYDYTQAECDNVAGTWYASSGAGSSSGVFGNGGSVASSASGASSSGRVCATNIQSLGDVLCKIGSLITFIIPLLVSLGVLYFVWGVVQYVIAGGEEAKKQGTQKIIYGLIGLVVIVGMWGLVRIVVNTFSISGGAPDISNLTSGITSGTTSTGGLCKLDKNPNLQGLLNYTTCMIGKSVIPLIFALAVAMFVWGVVQYVINSGEEAKKAQGRQFMLWGIIALVVMVSVWGIVGIIGKTFNVDNNGFIPQLKDK